MRVYTEIALATAVAALLACFGAHHADALGMVFICVTGGGAFLYLIWIFIQIAKRGY